MASDETKDNLGAPHDRRILDLIGEKVESAISPRSQEREYGSILPISWERGSAPGNARFDIKGGLTGDVLGLIGAGSAALRGRLYDPLDVTRGVMAVGSPNLARTRTSGVLRSAGPGDTPTPRLPESLKPVSETTLAPQNTLRRSLQEIDAGILSPEQTAKAARQTSPEGLQYAARLEEQRNAWQQMDSKRFYVQYLTQKLQEPNLTEQGIFKIQSRLQRARQEYQSAKQFAEYVGVKETDPYPVDIRITAEMGKFPGDEKYMYRSYAPEGYPFGSPGHDYANPAYRIPE